MCFHAWIIIIYFVIIIYSILIILINKLLNKYLQLQRILKEFQIIAIL